MEIMARDNASAAISLMTVIHLKGEDFENDQQGILAYK